MSRTAYVNGAYVPMGEACVHINDRGYQFADGVYEGIPVRRGKLIDLDLHMDRLWRSMRELKMFQPMDRRPMSFVFKEVIRRNRVSDGFLYIQITRGVAPRDHAFPTTPVMPALVVTCKRLDYDGVRAKAIAGAKASIQPDQRWARCDIKSTSLLPNILAKQAAREMGGFEAIMTDADGMVTEGSSTNVWIVKDGNLITRSIRDNILSGITRLRVMDLAEQLQISIREEAFSAEEMVSADEVFITSSTCSTMPIVEIDGKKIGDGTPGPVALRLVETYFNYTDA